MDVIGSNGRERIQRNRSGVEARVADAHMASYRREGPAPRKNSTSRFLLPTSGMTRLAQEVSRQGQFPAQRRRKLRKDAAATLEMLRAAAELAGEDPRSPKKRMRRSSGFPPCWSDSKSTPGFRGGNGRKRCDRLYQSRSGGGLEAQDWTECCIMYVRYAEQKGWKVKSLDVVAGEGIGLDRAVIRSRPCATPTAC